MSPTTTAQAPSVAVESREKEDTEKGKPKHVWMVKPCDWYYEEMKDCRAFKSRFHQYFVSGELEDCSRWRSDYDNCVKWEKNEDVQAVSEVIESEKGRIRKRLEGHYQNDVWEPRTEPLSKEVWSPPLPVDIAEGYEGSYLKGKADAIKTGEESLGDVDENWRDSSVLDGESSSCSIV